MDPTIHVMADSSDRVDITGTHDHDTSPSAQYVQRKDGAVSRPFPSRGPAEAAGMKQTRMPTVP